MAESPEALLQKIDLYRRYLAEGVSDDLARLYLKEIEKARVLLSDSTKPRNPPMADAAD